MSVRHVVALARAGSGWQAKCRCGWTDGHPARIGALASGNQHKNEQYKNEMAEPAGGSERPTDAAPAA